MAKQLGENDALAVDLLMDRSMSKDGKNIVSSYVGPVGDEVVHRVAAVESLLRIVGQMPTGEVPLGLASRTVDRVRHFRQYGVVPPRTAGEQMPSVSQSSPQA